jgi:hypothetical protein
MSVTHGDPIHGEVSSADAHAGVKFTLYKAGSKDAYTPLSTEYVTITDIVLVATAGGAYEIVGALSTASSAVDAAGLRVVKGTADALGGLVLRFDTPRTLPVDYVPFLIATAGQVDCIITGYISQG